MMSKSLSWEIRLLFLLVAALASGACATMTSDYSESGSPITEYPSSLTRERPAPSTNGVIQAP